MRTRCQILRLPATHTHYKKMIPSLALIFGPVPVKQPRINSRLRLRIRLRCHPLLIAILICAIRIHARLKNNILPVRAHQQAARLCRNRGHLFHRAPVRIHRPNLRTPATIRHPRNPLRVRCPLWPLVHAAVVCNLLRHTTIQCHNIDVPHGSVLLDIKLAHSKSNRLPIG